MHYRDWAWVTSDPSPQVRIGGWITPLLEFMGINLGKDAAGPNFIDAPYFRISTYLGGKHDRSYVYSYYLNRKAVKVLLPNKELASLQKPGVINFDIAQDAFFEPQGSLDPVTEPKMWSVLTRKDTYEDDESNPIFGPLRYQFQPYAEPIPHGALREAHEHIGRLQRWNKAQDRTIFKLKNKCIELSKTSKRQAEASAQFMKKVADILTRRAVAGCTAEDFVLPSTSAPTPQPLHDPLALGPPLTARQLRRRSRNPQALPSTSGNKSPSLASTNAGDDSEDEATASSHAK
ncbi:hypothetical protein Bca4012_064909 [Brassica carinata]